ncbi:hypothetical protein KI387_035684, partial [Taxus chinensis]
SCDASVLLDSTENVVSEKPADRNFGMRNFKYINTIKSAVEAECPGIVSCADIIVLAAREGAVVLGGPRVELKTGRRDSKKSSAAEVDKYIPLHNDSVSNCSNSFCFHGNRCRRRGGALRSAHRWQDALRESGAEAIPESGSHIRSRLRRVFE